MTLEEAVTYFTEEAERRERMSQLDGSFVNETRNEQEKRIHAEAAKNNRQLAEWLTDYKELKNSVGAVKLGNMKEALELIREYKADNVKQREQIAEYKRLLKLAVEDMKDKNFCKSVCSRDNFACRVSDTCDFRWRYADEVEKLLKED